MRDEKGVVVLAVIFIAMFCAIGGMILGSKAPTLLNGRTSPVPVGYGK